MGCISVIEEKKALRAKARQEAAAIPPELRRAQDKALFKAFLGLDAVKKAGSVLLFWGVGTEPETTGLLSALLASGKKVALPRCLPARGMEARFYRGGRLVRSPYGIPEPGEACPPADKGELAVALIPALCYDRRGYRLGHGGGYYARWLADYTGVTVGMCYKELLREELPREEHDRPVQILLTVTSV